MAPRCPQPESPVPARVPPQRGRTATPTFPEVHSEPGAFPPLPPGGENTHFKLVLPNPPLPYQMHFFSSRGLLGEGVIFIVGTTIIYSQPLGHLQ